MFFACSIEIDGFLYAYHIHKIGEKSGLCIRELSCRRDIIFHRPCFQKYEYLGIARKSTVNFKIIFLYLSVELFHFIALFQVLILTAVTTALCFLSPALNAFFLMILGVPSICLLSYNLKHEFEFRVTSLGRRCIALWIVAVFCWLNDKLLCGVWTRLGFPYLHGFWHILIFLAAYTGIVLFAYFDVKNHHPGKRPVIRYWPVDSFELGVPFVQLKGFRDHMFKDHQI